MRSLSEISSIEFSNSLKSEQLRVGMIIQATLGLGTLFFFAVVLFCTFIEQSKIIDPEILDYLKTLTIVNIVFFVVLSSVGQFIYHSSFSAKRLETAYSNDLHDREGNPIAATPTEKAIIAIRTAMLIRTALYEGSAFLGLAVLMMAATNGFLFSVDWLWINALPFLVHLIIIVFTFPTRNRVINIFENNIKGNL
jgi:hypothetical protein